MTGRRQCRRPRADAGPRSAPLPGRGSSAVVPRAGPAAVRGSPPGDQPPRRAAVPDRRRRQGGPSLQRWAYTRNLADERGAEEHDRGEVISQWVRRVTRPWHADDRPNRIDGLPPPPFRRQRALEPGGCIGAARPREHFVEVERCVVPSHQRHGKVGVASPPVADGRRTAGAEDLGDLGRRDDVAETRRLVGHGISHCASPPIRRWGAGPTRTALA